MSGISGDYGKLKRLRRNFDEMKNQAFRAGLTRQLAQHDRDMILRCFERGVNPYGKPWKPLKYRTGRPLRLTGRLYNSIGVRSSSHGWTVFTPVFYASFQNKGTRTIPARMYIPTHGLPAAWRAECVALALDYVRRFMKR